jgi:hypothetical protein
MKLFLRMGGSPQELELIVTRGAPNRLNRHESGDTAPRPIPIVAALVGSAHPVCLPPRTGVASGGGIMPQEDTS